MTSPAWDLAALRREEFPWSAGGLWLNHAGTGPIPARARRALADYEARRAEPHRLRPDDFLPVLAAARAAAAALVHAHPDEIALAPNTSFGVNLAALALALDPGDVIIASDGEFPALVQPFLQRAARPDGPRLELVPRTEAGWPDEAAMLGRLADPAVRVLAVSLTQFSTGYTVDLARLSREARRHGVLLVVDAIQAVGQLPVDLGAVPVDILACGAQKWLLGPWGTGFVYVRRALLTELAPPWGGWMAREGTDDFTRLCEYHRPLHADARRFEMPTLAYQSFVAMRESLGLLAELDPAAIAVHLRTLQEPMLAWAQRRGVRITSPMGARGSGILCVAPPDPAAATALLVEAGVELPLREGSLRVSPHAYNTLDEMEQLVALLDRAT